MGGTRFKLSPKRNLIIEKNGKEITQSCPYSTDIQACGQWCPHMGEVQEFNNIDTGGERSFTLALTCGKGTKFSFWDKDTTIDDVVQK